MIEYIKNNLYFLIIVSVVNIINILILSFSFLFIKKDIFIRSLLKKIIFCLLLCVALYFATNYFIKIVFFNFLKYLWLPSFLFVISSVVYNEFFSKSIRRKEKLSKKFIKKTDYEFKLEVKGDKDIYFTEPFDNFLIYGGANSGKTKSLGRPLAYEFMRHKFGAFFFDYKDKDYTKFIYQMNTTIENPLPFYYLNFVDLDYSYRTNIIKKSVIDNHPELMQVIGDFFTALKSKDGKEDEWFSGALGILKGVATRFFYDYEEYLTLPHILLFCLNNSALQIASFCLKRPESSIYAQTIISAMDSPKTMASFLSSLQRPISDTASNKNICYVLSGDDFDFNLIEPNNPKLFAVSNSYQIENVLSPIISAMVSISSRKFSLENKVPFVYFLDEATTFKINNFENMPSVLREYLCAFVFITQSNSKVEKRYDRLDRSSIESNFGNQFLGKTKDVRATKDYVYMFSKIEEIKVSQTKGESTRSSSKSVTESTQDKNKYFEDFFGKLSPGNFVGSALNSNYQEFNLQFKMFNNEALKTVELPKVKEVSNWEVENNYTKLLKEVKDISIGNIIPKTFKID